MMFLKNLENLKEKMCMPCTDHQTIWWGAIQSKNEGKKCKGCPKPNYVSVGSTVRNIFCYILKHTKKRYNPIKALKKFTWVQSTNFKVLCPKEAN